MSQSSEFCFLRMSYFNVFKRLSDLQHIIYIAIWVYKQISAQTIQSTTETWLSYIYKWPRSLFTHTYLLVNILILELSILVTLRDYISVVIYVYLFLIKQIVLFYASCEIFSAMLALQNITLEVQSLCVWVFVRNLLPPQEFFTHLETPSLPA